MTLTGCRPLTLPELEKLLVAVWDQYKRPVAERLSAQLIVMAYCGLRISESCQLHVADVRKGHNIAADLHLPRIITKGKRRDWNIPLAERPRTELLRWLIYSQLIDSPNTAWLFPPVKCSMTAQPLYHWERHIDHRSVRKELVRMVEYVGLEGWISTHSLRKRFGTDVFLNSGGNILIAQRALRHMDVSSTQKYIGISYDSIRDAVYKL